MNNIEKAKRIFSITLAVIIAMIVSFYFAKAEKFWMPITAILVMQTTAGAQLRRGLINFFIIVVVVVVGTLFSELVFKYLNFTTLYSRLYDISLGAVIGIATNLIVFPKRPDIEFRNSLIPILKAYSDYLSAILNIFLKKEKSEYAASSAKSELEYATVKFSPLWVYQPGFSYSLQQGHRHFLVMISRVEQILFSMHHIARHNLENEFLPEFANLLQHFVADSNKIIHALITVLSLNKLSEGVNDLSEEFSLIEQEFQEIFPKSNEMLEISDNYIYLAALVADLKDLRITLLKLAAALR